VDLATGGNVRLELYDARGQRVRSLVTGFVAAGRREFTWDGRNEGGRTAATGTYFARFEVGEVRQTAKLTLLK
jgi:flagellar hook assembly protein FlgD